MHIVLRNKEIYNIIHTIIKVTGQAGAAWLGTTHGGAGLLELQAMAFESESKVWILDSLLTKCAMLGKLLAFPMAQFPHL